MDMWCNWLAFGTVTAAGAQAITGSSPVMSARHNRLYSVR